MAKELSFEWTMQTSSSFFPSDITKRSLKMNRQAYWSKNNERVNEASNENESICLYHNRVIKRCKK